MAKMTTLSPDDLAHMKWASDALGRITSIQGRTALGKRSILAVFPGETRPRGFDDFDSFEAAAKAGDVLVDDCVWMKRPVKGLSYMC